MELENVHAIIEPGIRFFRRRVTLAKLRKLVVIVARSLRDEGSAKDHRVLEGGNFPMYGPEVANRQESPKSVLCRKSVAGQCNKFCHELAYHRRSPKDSRCCHFWRERNLHVKKIVGGQCGRAGWNAVL